MKKLLLTLLVLLFCSLGLAGDKVEVLKFEWEQDAESLAIMTKWELHWSDVAGSNYLLATEIPKPPDATGPTFYSDTTLTVTGIPGSTVTKYFVLRACTPTECSGWSNEVSYGFKIPVGAPFNVKVQVVVIPQ